MFKFSETERYNIKTKAVLTDAIKSAYNKAQTVLPKEAPDTFLLVSSCLSYAILTFMTILTAVKENGSQQMILWYAFAALFAFLFILTVVKYFKNRKEFKNDAKTVNKADKKTASFLELFEADSLPEKMPAYELSKKVSALTGKQSDNIINNALKELSSTLNVKNNPQDLLCKNLTPMGTMFPAPRQRFYFKQENGTFVFFDDDFANPAGEFICDEDDLLAYGSFNDFSDSDKQIISKSGKVRQDSCIMKVSDGNDYYFFEFQSADSSKLKKVLPSRKEL